VLDRLTSLVGAWEYKDANDTLERQFHDAGLDLQHPQIRKFCELCLRFRICRVISANIPAAWSFAKGNSIPWCRWSPPPCPACGGAMGQRRCADMGIVKVDLLGLA